MTPVVGGGRATTRSVVPVNDRGDGRWGSPIAQVDVNLDMVEVGVARRHVRAALLRHGCADGVEDVMLVLSELLANAVAHARIVVRTSVFLCESEVRIEVYDDDPAIPQPLDP